MTTTTFPTASGATPRLAQLRPVLRSEWIKLRSVRSTPVFLGLSGALGVGMSILLGVILVTDPYEHLPFTIGNSFLVSTWLTMLFAIVAGALVITSEVQHGTLATVLTARPSKPVLVAAKACTAAALGLAMGVIGITGGLVGGVASGMDAGDLSHAVAGTAWALVLTTIAPVVGLGVGLLIRNSAAAVTTVLVWALAIEPLAQSLLPATVTRLLPFTAAHGLTGTRSASDTKRTLEIAFSNTGNVIVIGCWAAVTVAIGTAILLRQDT